MLHQVRLGRGFECWGDASGLGHDGPVAVSHVMRPNQSPDVVPVTRLNEETRMV